MHDTQAVTPPEYLNRFRYRYTKIQITLFCMVWIGKNDFNADPFNLDQNTIRGVVLIRIRINCPCLGKQSILK